MKIVTWNINGIRAIKSPFSDILNSFDADIICFQETKITRSQLDETIALVEGYNSYFSFSKVRDGYSGTATYVRNSYTPVCAEEGLAGELAPEISQQFEQQELKSLDAEGRAVITQHQMQDQQSTVRRLVTVFNVYCPRADPDREDRAQYKLRFYDLLEARAKAFLQSGSDVLIVGDLNTSHKRIDTCDPAEDFDESRARQWMDRLLDATSNNHNFVDGFRHLHPTRENAFTCWSTVTNARSNNYGTRIDYILLNDSLKDRLEKCDIQPEVHGSDHCPVTATLSFTGVAAAKPPALCSKYLQEFSGQQKLSNLWQKRPCKYPPEDQISHKRSTSPVLSNNVKKKKPNAVKQTKPNAIKQTNLFSFVQKRSDKRMDLESGEAKVKQDVVMNKEKPNLQQDSWLKQSNLAQVESTLTPSSLPLSQTEVEVTASLSLQTQVEAEVTLTPPESQPLASAVNNSEKLSSDETTVSKWKVLLAGPPAAPPCRRHKEPCVSRTVKKPGPNKGRQFWVCARGEGHKNDPAARCDHFQWIKR